MLLASDPGDSQLHESYLPQNPKVFTRKDFGWPNALLAEFMLTTIKGHAPLPVPPSPVSRTSPAPQKRAEPPKNGI